MTKYNTKVTNLDEGEIEIEAQIEWPEVEKHRPSIIKKYSQNIKIDGFRQGHVPENVVVEKIGDANIISDMAEKALQKAYPEIAKEAEIKAIGNPKINVTKLAQGNPLEFKITTAVMPEVKLPNYKDIATTINSRKENSTAGKAGIKVEDKEIEDAIKHIREQWVRTDKIQNMVNRDGKPLEGVDPTKIEIKDEELPEFDDEFVKKIGAFENVEDFKTKLRANMLQEKILRTKEKRRAEILEKISENTTVVIPAIVTEGELNRMTAQFKADVDKAGIKFEDYLTQSGKTEEDMRKGWKPDAEKYAKNQLLINEIAILENIKTDEKEVKEEVDKIVKNYKDADPERARIYVETLMINEKVFEFLESLSEDDAQANTSAIG